MAELLHLMMSTRISNFANSQTNCPMHDDDHDSAASHEPGTLQTRRSFLRTSVLGAAAS